MRRVAVNQVGARVDEAERQFYIWAAKLDALAARVDSAGGQIETLHRQHVEHMKTDLAALRIVYRKLTHSPSRTWGLHKKDFVAAWDDLAAAFDELGY